MRHYSFREAPTGIESATEPDSILLSLLSKIFKKNAG